MHGVDGFDRPLAILHAFDAPASPSAQVSAAVGQQLSLLSLTPARLPISNIALGTREKALFVTNRPLTLPYSAKL